MSELLFPKEYTQTDEFAGYVKQTIGDEPIHLDLNGLGYCKVFKKSRFLRQPFYWWKGDPVLTDPKGFDYFKKWLNGKKYRGTGTYNFMNSTNEWHTIHIDLTKGMKNIIQNADKNQVRNVIKRNRKRGLTVKFVSSENDIQSYYAMLKPHYSFALFKLLFESKTFFALKAVFDNSPVGFMGFRLYNNKVQEQGIAHKRMTGIYPIDTLRYVGMYIGSYNNCTVYDLAGINPDPRTKKELGISRNKKKWNGDMVRYFIFRNGLS